MLGSRLGKSVIAGWARTDENVISVVKWAPWIPRDVIRHPRKERADVVVSVRLLAAVGG